MREGNKHDIKEHKLYMCLYDKYDYMNARSHSLFALRTTHDDNYNVDPHYLLQSSHGVQKCMYTWK